MSDVGQLIQACVASGIVLSSLCAMIVIPVFLWLAIWRLTPAIVSMHADPAWQAPIAACAAALPGSAFGLFATEALITGSNSRCLAFVSGRVFFGVVLVAAIAAFVRATVRAGRQHAEVRRLFSRSIAPTERLRRIGNELSLRVRSLQSDESFCALAGVVASTAFVSTATENRLSDDELRAALLHERAHRTRYDQILIATLTFATDLLPLPVEQLVSTYRRARELAADQKAAQEGDPVHVAAAILATARGKSVSLAAALSSESTIVRARLDALLNGREPSGSRSSRFVAVLSLVILAVFTLSSAVASLIVSAACAHLTSM